MKKFTIYVDTYKGVDGSSLSQTRCDQILLIYDMLNEIGDKEITYVALQEEAAKRNLFGKTKAESAIRTFFPLLRKLNFVDYEEPFLANECFTNLGKMFVLTINALQNLGDDEDSKEIEELLKRIKENIIKQGLLYMYREYSSHNLWKAVEILKIKGKIRWKEYLYCLYGEQKGLSIEESLALMEKEDIDSCEFVNEKNESVKDTSFSYINRLLIEAGLAKDSINDETLITINFNNFYKLLNGE